MMADLEVIAQSLLNYQFCPFKVHRENVLALFVEVLKLPGIFLRRRGGRRRRRRRGT